MMTATVESDSVRCAALFVAAHQRDRIVGTQAVREAIDRTIGEFGATECAARVAEEFGNHPDTAVSRMRWARAVVEQTFPGGRQ